jgi:uncharacterized membrane protein
MSGGTRMISNPSHRTPCTILAVFALVHALIFVPNHLLFRTAALDLGLYTHAAFTYAHGHLADCMLFLGDHHLLLADHFDLHLLLWSPLTWIFGTWTLLLVQWAAVLGGAWGMYRWLSALGAPHRIATLGLVHFCAFFGIIGAFTFDFHSNVVATIALPWFGLALHHRRWYTSWLLLLFMLAAKENMGIWLSAVTFGFLLHYWRDRRMRTILAAQSLIALAWSVVVIAWVMPALSDGGGYDNWKFPALGHGPMDALRTIIGHPLNVIDALLDGGGVHQGRAIKLEMLLFVFLTGGWAMLCRPWTLVMIVPLLLQKLLHEGPVQWSVLAHYAVEFAPLCTFAIYGWPALWEPQRWKVRLTWMGALLSVAVTFRVMDASIYTEDRAKQRFYQSDHYHRDFDVRGVRAILASVPGDASISVLSPLLPQLTMRKNLYLFPIAPQVDYILLATRVEPYPLNKGQFAEALDSLANSRFWHLEKQCDGAVLYMRTSP